MKLIKLHLLAMIFAFGNTVQAGIQVSIFSDFRTCRTVNWVYEMRSYFITKIEIKNKCVTQRLDKGMWVAQLGRARIFVHSLDSIIVFFISFVIKFPFTLGHKHSPCCQLYEKEEQIAYSINMFIHLYIHD